jgi:outer membrane immunogenic protein
MKKYRSVATVLLALSSGAALAADLPSRKGPPPAYLPPPPAFSWNGLYGGVNIGYGFGNGDNGSGAYYAPAPVIFVAVPPPATLLGFNTGNDLNGVVGGGQIGYNWQFSSWLVLGLEADIQAADLRSHGATYSAPFVNTTKSVDWFGTVRARVGVTPFMPNLLIYGTGGFAYGQVNQYANVFDGAGAFGSASFDDTKTGWTAGGGVEWSPASFPAWSLKVEYLYTDLGSTNLTGYSIAPAGAFVFSHSSETRFHTVRAGLNWHFNPFAPAPVLAKY